MLVNKSSFSSNSRSQAWFKGSLNQRADKAYPPVTLESIKEADNQLKKKKNEFYSPTKEGTKATRIISTTKMPAE